MPTLTPHEISSLHDKVRALAAERNAVILAHNHPSGSTEPSAADREATRRISRAGVELGIPLLDHHQQSGLDSMLGRVTETWFRRGALMGRLKFNQTEQGQKAEGMVARNEVAGISAGYRVEEWEITDPDGKVVDPAQLGLELGDSLGQHREVLGVDDQGDVAAIGQPVASLAVCAISLTVYERLPPMMTGPVGHPTTAETMARATSPTWTRSRRCSPSP